MDLVQPDQADTSNSCIEKHGLDDETIDNESMYSEPIEDDSDHFVQNPVFSTPRSKRFNAVGKQSVAGPSAKR